MQMTPDLIKLLSTLNVIDKEIRAAVGKVLTTKSARLEHVRNSATAYIYMGIVHLTALDPSPDKDIPDVGTLVDVAINAIETAIENHKHRN